MKIRETEKRRDDRGMGRNKDSVILLDYCYSMLNYLVGLLLWSVSDAMCYVQQFACVALLLLVLIFLYLCQSIW